jgi:hypothetical protein
MTLWEDVGSSVEHGGGDHWLWRSVAGGQLLESRAREPYLHPSSSERVTTPAAFIPRGRIPDRAGCAIRPGLRGRWASRDAGEVAPRPPTYKERQRHIRRYGRANKHPGRGETPPSPARVFALWPCASTRSTGKNAYGSSAVTPRLMLGEAFLGLQQPMHHQQLAHQVVEAWLAVRQFGSLTALVRSAWACSDSSGAIRRGSAMFLAPRSTHPAPLPGRG